MTGARKDDGWLDAELLKLRGLDHCKAVPSERIEDLLDGIGDEAERLQTARAVVGSSEARRHMRELLAAGNAAAAVPARPLQRIRASSVLVSIAACLVAALLVWPLLHRGGGSRLLGTVSVVTVSPTMVDEVCSFRATATDQLEFASALPGGTAVMWVARPFNNQWKRQEAGLAGDRLEVGKLVKKPGAYLLVVTTGEASEVDSLLARMALPSDLGGKGLEEVAAAVADAVKRTGVPANMVLGVCEFR